MAYIIQISTNLTTMANRDYYAEPLEDCTEPEAWGFYEEEAYEFNTKQDAEEKADEIVEAFKAYNVEVTCSVSEKETYDVVFNDDEKSDRKGWRATFEECKDYIETYNGTNESYFEDYKGGVVAIVSNTTSDIIFEKGVE